METAGNKRLGILLAIYLTGLLIGGLYVGMVAPMRTVVQDAFGIDDTVGIWMINIYTLFYASFIPVIGKLADRYGRKGAFVVCLGAFASGAALCGAADALGSFNVLLVGRIIQAVGACGMIPVANAEIGTAFPPQKRGMALGLAAAVAGLANVFGAAAGSALLDAFGAERWPWLFFACIPLCVLLIVCSMVFLPKRGKGQTAGALDVPGAVLLVALVFLLLMSLRSLDVFDVSTLAAPAFLLPLACAVCIALAFRAVERRASDPIFHLEYLHSVPILITMAVSFFIGCMTISMTLVPELAEFLLGLPAGAGGYYVAAIGVFSLAGPPVAGKLIDRWGAKPVLMAGLAVTAAGFVFLALVATAHPSSGLLVAGLCVVGLGMGFSMGAPTNYMILESTEAGQSTAAIATIALVRQVGTTLAPALLVGFITAGSGADGFVRMLLCVAVFCVLALVLMCWYRSAEQRGGR